jgi:hypothetical protein
VSTENVMVVVDEGVPGHDMSVEVTAKYRADGGIDILSVREHPQADPHVKSPLPAQAGGGEETSILDSSAKSFKQKLWMATNDDGSYVITDEANKGGLSGFAPPWGKSYREVLNDFMRHRDRSESSAIELYAAIHRGIHAVPGTFDTSPKVRGVYIVSKGTAYKVLAGTHHQGRFLGFGGQKFRVTLKSGEVIESNNTWYIGKVAPHLRKHFPDNATMEAIP